MILEPLFPGQPVSFRTTEQVRSELEEACARHRAIATYHEFGTSEEGRPLYGIELGNGPDRICLLAGSHSDEPVGPETLRRFALEGLAHADELSELWEQYTFFVLPHINPDGEAENQAWIEEWPDAGSYLEHRFRELPGRDLEFGYPSMRVENEAVSSYLREHAPFTLHVSLHGMGLSEGGLLLIERHWIDRTEALRERFRTMMGDHGLGLHDHDRAGEKGFVYIGPGFSTTPEGTAMTEHFLEKGDEEMASNFHQSSMEYVRSLGGDPLCLVTEFPLYLIENRSPESEPGHPAAYLELKDRLPELTEMSRRNESIAPVLEEYGVRPLPLEEAITLQLETIEHGLAAATR